MAARPRTFEVRPLPGEPGWHELALEGKVYADVAPELRDALLGGHEQGLRRLVVDARRLEQIDSAGLGAFVELLKRLRPEGGRIVFYGLSPGIERVFEITKLRKVIDVVPERADALREVPS